MSTEVKEVKVDSNLIEIEIQVREFERKTDKVKFLGYKALTKEGAWIDCKFTKDVEKKSQPTKNCIIVCDKKDVNYVGKERVMFPHIWVKEILEIKDLYNPADNYTTDLPF